MRLAPDPREFESYKDFLHAELSYRHEKNPSYSLRAFARDLGVSPSRLSLVLQQKANLSFQKARLASECLFKANEDKKYFEQLVLAEVARNKKISEEAKSFVQKHRREGTARELLDTEFACISEWYFLAIFNFLLIANTKQKTEIYNEFPFLSKTEIDRVLSILLRLDIVEQAADGVFEAKEDFITAIYGYKSMAVRIYHKSILKQSIELMERLPVEERCFHSRMLPMTFDDYQKVKTYMEQNMAELNTKFSLSKKEGKKAVYAVNFQIVRLNQSKEV